MLKGFTKQERSWIMYDWANSSYATIMMAAVFPVFFTAVALESGADGDIWWGWGTSIATALVAVMAPFLGVVGDYKGMKKKLLTAFLLIGLIFTTLCGLVSSWQWMLVGYVISYVGFAGSNLFYDSFLTDITTKARMDKVSAWGYGMGYIGGSTIPFIASILLITFQEPIGIDMATAVKLSIFLAVLWWAVFSIPILKNCHQEYGQDKPSEQMIGHTLKRLKASIKSLLKNKTIALYILAYFFYIDGVGTVMKMSTAYGTTLGLDSTGLIVALVATQLIGFPCAILFSTLSKKYGTIPMLFLAVGVYTFICILGFVMGLGIEEGFLTNGEALTIFWVLAVLVGSVQGGIQALSRSFFGKLIPKERSSEYFGIFDIFGKFAAILGPAIYAGAKIMTGRSSFSILAIILLFIAGGGILFYGRKEFQAIDEREAV